MKELSYEELLEQDVAMLEQEISILEQEIREAREEKNKQEISRLEREEKTKRHISDLERLIYEKDDAFDREQGKRVKITFLVLSGIIYLVAFMSDKTSGTDYLRWILAAPIMAGLIMFVSYGVWAYIIHGALKRAETIAGLKGELIAIKLSKYDKE